MRMPKARRDYLLEVLEGMEHEDPKQQKIHDDLIIDLRYAKQKDENPSNQSVRSNKKVE